MTTASLQIPQSKSTGKNFFRNIRTSASPWLLGHSTINHLWVGSFFVFFRACFPVVRRPCRPAGVLLDMMAAAVAITALWVL
jgi:hypothetical protein